MPRNVRSRASRGFHNPELEREYEKYLELNKPRPKRRKRKRKGGWVDYKGYLRSKAWSARKKRYREKHGSNCERCGRGKCITHFHHVSYERLGKERDADLLLLCETCHAEEHDLDPPMSAEVDDEFLRVVRGF